VFDAHLLSELTRSHTRSIDQLDKADAPPIPETYIFLLSLQCLNAIADGFASFTLPIYTNIMDARASNHNTKPPALDLSSESETPALTDTQIGRETYTSFRSVRGMADAGWPALLASLSFFLTTNLDDGLFTDTLSSFQNFTTTCGVLGLRTPRDAFLISLCKFAVPPAIISHLANLEGGGGSTGMGGVMSGHSGVGKQSASMLAAGADALGLTAALGGGANIQMTLSSRNLLCLRSLVGVSQALAGSLEKTWFYVFEALQNADYVVRADSSRRQKKRSGGHPSTPSLSGPSSSPSKAGVSASSHSMGASGSGGQQNPLARFVPTDADEQAASHRTARLFEVSKALDDEAFKWFLGALCRLNGEMIGIPTTAEGVLETSARDDGVRNSALLSPTGSTDDPMASGDLMPEKESRKIRRSGINVIRTLVSLL